MTSTTLSHHHHNLHPSSSSSSSASTTPVHHHSHFAHHVRTRAWGIEPGWKFVTHDTQKVRNVPITIESPDGGVHNNRSYRNGTSVFEARFGSHSDNSGRHHNNHHHTSSLTSSSVAPFSSSLRGSSFRLPSSVRRSTVASRSKTDDDCPVHSTYHHQPRTATTSSYSSHYNPTSSLSFPTPKPQPPQPSTLPRSAKLNYPCLDYPPSAGGSSGHSPSSSFSSASSTSSTSSSSSPPSSTEFVLQGVLKKPGSYRGPKSMKKVAFLENAEFSRGLP